MEEQGFALVLMGQESCWMKEREFQKGPARWSDQSLIWWGSWGLMLADGISGAKVFCICPVTPGMSDLWSSCLPGPGQSFLPHPSNRLGSEESDGFGLYDETASHPCIRPCLLPPMDSISPQSTYLHTERPKEGIHGSLSPLAPWEEQGIWTAAWEPFENVFLFSSSCLASYLFIMVWPFLKSGKEKISLSLGGWDPLLWTTGIGCASGSLAPAGGWTAGLFPMINFGLLGGSLGWWAPSLAWRFFCVSIIVSGLLGRQPTLHHYGADFLVRIRRVFGHFSFPLCLLSVCFSASALAPKCRRRCQEKELEWNTGHSFSQSSIKRVFEQQSCRGRRYMDPMFEEFKHLVVRTRCS